MWVQVSQRIFPPLAMSVDAGSFQSLLDPLTPLRAHRYFCKKRKMSVIIRLDSREDTLLSALLIQYLLKPPQIFFVPFSLKVLRTSNRLVTFPKGPFAHKKSKEQYFVSKVSVKIALSTSLRLAPLFFKSARRLFTRTPLCVRVYYL